MKSPFLSRPALRRKKESGLSLVLVLFAVLSLSFLIVLFFSLASNDRSSTSAYTNAMKAEDLGTGGLELVISELRKEITDPTRSDVNPSNQSDPGPRVYTPSKPEYILPQFTTTDSYGNLVAISQSGTGVYANSTLVGSTALTTGTSRNGRAFSVTRWAKPALSKEFGTTAGSVPSWIYVGRNGPITQPTLPQIADVNQADFALGRIAFAVYDVSGLLDMNVAGYPSTMTPKDAEMKGSAALAKLQTLGFTDGQVNSLISFRNPASSSDYAAYLKNTFGHKGYTQTVPGDNRFLSRQELIRFATRNGFADRLYLLTMFSREKNAPAYAPDAINTTNPNLTTARHNSGRQLFEQRFPLEKLSIFSNTAVDLSNAQNTKDLASYFGLIYDPSSRSFTYVGSGGDNHIKTLSEIANERTYRVPNFFETLKAVILKDSIGQGAGTTATVSDDSDKDRHILQIGANIIDQYDLDPDIDKNSGTPIPLPTTITLGSRTVYGVENLPYVNKISILGELLGTGGAFTGEPNNMNVGLDNATKGSDPYAFQAAVEMWNPNFPKLPAQMQASERYDPQIRVRLSGNTQVTLFAREDATAGSGTPAVGDNTPPIQRPAEAINAEKIFNVTGGEGGSDYVYNYFVEPRLVRMAKAMSQFNYNKLTGQNASTGTPAEQQNAKNFCFKSAIITLNSASPLSVELAVLDKDGLPRVYQKTLDSVTTQLKLSATTIPINAAGRVNRTTSLVHSDPRTNRMGYFAMNFTSHYKPPTAAVVTATGTNAANPIGSSPNTAPSASTFFAANATYPFSIRPQMSPFGGAGDSSGYGICTTDGLTGSGYSTQAGGPYYLGLLWENNNPVTRIQDGDGIYRVGDGGYIDAGASGSLSPMATIARYRNPTVAWPDNSAVRTPGVNTSRPTILDRAFRSVADMGYTYRDIPWRSLNFSGTDSADAGLLDAFSIEDVPAIEGKVSLNTPHPEVLKALLAGSLKEERTSTCYLQDTEAETLAKAIIAKTKGTSTTPIQNIAEMVTKFSTVDVLNSNTLGKDSTGNNPSYAIKAERESMIRALSSSTQTRTWNFLIDLVAQTGRFPVGAKDLNDFTVEGERRYWLHVAIDRYTSEVVAELLETVNE